MEFTNIKPNKNYQRISNGWVHTGQQILNLLELAPAKMQAIILLDIWQTDEPAGNPKDRYGIPPKTWTESKGGDA